MELTSRISPEMASGKTLERSSLKKKVSLTTGLSEVFPIMTYSCLAIFRLMCHNEYLRE